MLQRLDLSDDFVDGPARLTRIENGLHRAKVALEMAAAAGFDQTDWQIAFAAEDGTVRFQIRKRWPCGLTIKLFQSAMSRVVNHARPKFFGFTADDGFSMLRDFIRAERGMKPTHDDRHAAFAKFGRDLKGAFCRVGLNADSDKVGRLVERNRFHPVIVKTDFNVTRRQPG